MRVDRTGSVLRSHSPRSTKSESDVPNVDSVSSRDALNAAMGVGVSVDTLSAGGVSMSSSRRKSTGSTSGASSGTSTSSTNSTNSSSKGWLELALGATSDSSASGGESIASAPGSSKLSSGTGGA